MRFVLLFLLIAIVAPAACVFWFMNQAARSQAESAERGVTEAYRGQLRFLRERLDQYWANRAATLQRGAGARKPAELPPELARLSFRRVVLQKAADSIIFLNANGSAAYPTLAIPPFPDPQDNSPARAAQARIRALVQRGDKAGAIAAIDRDFRLDAAQRGDEIALDEQLLKLKLANASPARLTRLIDDYTVPIRPPHRLFLMDQVRALAPSTDFPTYAAERLAAQFLESDGARADGAGLQKTRLPGVWRLASPDSRVVALLRTDTVMAGMREALESNPSPSVRFAALPPGEASSADSIPAGAQLPGWQIAFSLLDRRPLEEARRRRMASYLWIGYLAIAAIAGAGLIAGQFFRRQLRLARLKTDLVAAVSHELKTPLASMRVLLDALLDDDSPDPRKTREYLQLISGENQRLTRLIENFLTFARIERNRQRFEFIPTDPGRVVQSAALAMRERAPIETESEAALPPVHADEDALVTALLNLLDNAYKYTPAEKRISLRAYRDGASVVFAVEDNGIGIAPREQKRIFRKFYQVDRRLARETGGCGLGLSIVDEIVRAHGGSVRLQSRPGQGSTFFVSLPC
jgi:signal transduction histidine kinase